MPPRIVPWSTWKNEATHDFESGTGISRLQDLQHALRRRDVTWIVGAGVTAGLLASRRFRASKIEMDIAPIKGWPALINNLLTKASLRPLSKAMRDEPELLELAYRCRQLLKVKGKWPTALQDTVRTALESFDSIGPNSFLKPWQKVISQLGNAATENRTPRILTTNYDDILARSLNWNVLYLPDEAPSHLPDTDPSLFNAGQLPFDVATDSISPERLVRFSQPGFEHQAPINRGPNLLSELQRLEDFWVLHRRGWLDRSQQFIVHLHGWVGSPKSMVFDPGDYRQVERQVFSQIRAALSAQDQPVTIIGTGEGLLDPHFVEYWVKVPQDSELAETNIWLVHEDEARQLLKVAKKKGIDLTSKLVIVTFDSFSDLPKILLAIIR